MTSQKLINLNYLDTINIAIIIVIYQLDIKKHWEEETSIIENIGVMTIIIIKIKGHNNIITITIIIKLL